MSTGARVPTPKSASMLGRAFQILRAFGPDDRTLTLTELVVRTGLPKPTVFRLIGELEQWGAIEKATPGYRLGPALFELGLLARSQTTLREQALPYMEDLYEATHETVHLATLAGTEILIVEKISGHRKAPTPSKVGGRGPAHCTARGKAILAFSGPETVDQVIAAGLVRRTPYTTVLPRLLREQLAEVRRLGFAMELEESSIGIACTAAPIFAQGRGVIGAVSVAAQLHQRDIETLVAPVRQAAAAISRAGA
jgi:DNA-binding IclR family transcriptional regulator